MTLTTEIVVKNLNFYYNGDVHALQNISMPVYKNKITALIGPSGCGKSTLLRTFNRMYELYPGQRATGEILLDEQTERAIAGLAETESIGPLQLRGFQHPLAGFRLKALSVR